MSGFQLQADMYNSITPSEIEVRNLEERLKELENKVKELKNERPHGKWVYDYLGYLICSECGYECLYDEEGLYSLGCYCHHCGADMRGDENGEIK